MVQKNSKLNVSDTCGVVSVKCFHIYQKKKLLIGTVGNFLKVSIRKTHARLKQKLRRKKSKAIFIISKQFFSKPDGSTIKFYKNNCVLLKKRLTPRGKLVSGPIVYNFKRKKFITSFSRII